MAISRRIRGHYLLVVRFSTDNGERQDVSPPILERTWCAGKSTVVRSRGVEQGVWQFDGRLNFARAVGGRIGRLTSLRSPVAMPLRRAAGRKSSDFGADVVAGKSTAVRSRAVEPGLWHPTVARQSRAGGGDRCRVPRRRLIPVLP